MYNEKCVAQSPLGATSQTPPKTAIAPAALMSPTVNDIHHHNINMNLSSHHSHSHSLSHSHHHLQTHPHSSQDGKEHRHSTLPLLHPHHMEMQMPHLQLSHHNTQQQQPIHLPRHAALSPQHLVQPQDQQQLHQIQHQQQQQGVLNHQTAVSQMQQSQQHPQQQQSTMFTRFDANKSTKGASKLRRDLINTEIANLRDLLPLPQSTRQRLSQLQLMALVCVYVRKANYFQQVFKRHDVSMLQAPTPNIGFSKALSGFLMMLTQNGKLLYISDNAAEYLGHSMEDLLIHGDSVYDIIDKQDHTTIQTELNRNIPPVNVQHSTNSGGCVASSTSAATTTNFNSLEGSRRMFLCRMNVSRNARRQMRFGDQKVVLVQGHYLSFLPLCSRNEPVFLATCTPIAMPETRECVVQGATNVFTTIHSMDMKIVHIDKNGEFHLGYTKNSIQGFSWYNFIHSDNLREAQGKHRLITQSEQDRSCILLIRMQRRQSDFIWVHVVLQVRDSQDSNQQPVIVCTNQVLNESEASVMIANSWLYHYYAVQSKVQFSMAYDGESRLPPTTPAVTAAYYQHHQHGSHIALAPSETFHGNIGTYPTIHPHHGHHPTPLNYHHHQHQIHDYHNTGTSAVYHATPSVLSSPRLEDSHSHTTHQLHNHHKSNNNLNYSNREENGGRGERVTAIRSTLFENLKSGKDLYNNQHQNRISTEPVDFSQISNCTSLNTSRSPNGRKSTIRCNSSNSSASSHANNSSVSRNSSNRDFTTNSKQSNVKTFRHSPPPSKKRIISKLEPLYLSDEQINHEEISLNTKIDTSHSHFSVTPTEPIELNSASVGFATVVPTRPRFPNKAFVTEPPDFIDQWNPSPPWSENAQKVSLDSSSSSQQELSPYITTTPPTPNSAPPSSVGSTECQILGPAFSFEWMSDQLVPVVDPCISCLTPERIPVMLTHGGNRQLWPPSTTLPSTQHHHHLSQHLASHAHHLLSLQTGGLINQAIEIHSMEDVTKKKEKPEDVDDK